MLLAFNVDQQRQFFESDDLNGEGMERLAGALRQLELARTIRWNIRMDGRIW